LQVGRLNDDTLPGVAAVLLQTDALPLFPALPADPPASFSCIQWQTSELGLNEPACNASLSIHTTKPRWLKDALAPTSENCGPALYHHRLLGSTTCYAGPQSMKSMLKTADLIKDPHDVLD